ncbi:MAG: hypothetical protein HY583_01555 [Candidatus Omnitrophica bacterium]|nr:hypothetical protein [Candidatus Omnitrophota bacterium]
MTLISERAGVKEEKEQKTLAPSLQVPSSPFHPDTKPYDNRLPGDHHLTMVIWRGGTPVALIDGRLLKKGDVIDNKTLTSIESNGVWFAEDGVKFYLGLEK